MPGPSRKCCLGKPPPLAPAAAPRPSSAASRDRDRRRAPGCARFLAAERFRLAVGTAISCRLPLPVSSPWDFFPGKTAQQYTQIAPVPQARLNFARGRELIAHLSPVGYLSSAGDLAGWRSVMSGRIASLAAISFAAISVAAAASFSSPPRKPPKKAKTSGYHVAKTIPIGGDGGWDYATTDPVARRIYISHDTHVVVLDADTQAKIGDVPGTQRIHGIAIAAEFGRGYISNGATNNVTVFDLKSLKTLGWISAGSNPDAIVYDAASKRVFAMNGRSGDITAINAADGAIA